ncbi:MAG: hypothetical protein GKR91_05410 [Pseudomonadales bacterium]|nr:hypothetical protein [Pseudomonadales bacterium]
MIRKFLIPVFILCLESPWIYADEDGHDSDRDDFSYSYIEISSLGYDMDVNGIDIEPNGYKAELSVSLGDSLFGIIDRKKSDERFLGGNYDFDTEGYGFGFRGERWFASYTYNNWDMDNNEFDVDTVRLGFRNMWTDRLEFNASYSWNNFEDLDSEDGFQAGFAYHFTDSFHLVADYETIGGHFDIDYVSIGLKLSF